MWRVDWQPNFRRSTGWSTGRFNRQVTGRVGSRKSTTSLTSTRQQYNYGTVCSLLSVTHLTWHLYLIEHFRLPLSFTRDFFTSFYNKFLQRAALQALYCYGNSVRRSVRLSHAGIVYDTSLSAITTKWSTYSNSHGKSSLNSLDIASNIITSSNGLNAEPWCMSAFTSKLSLFLKNFTACKILTPDISHPLLRAQHTSTPPHHNRFTALFPGPPGWAGARRELLDFMVRGEINRGRHTDHLAGLHSIWTNQCPPPPSRHVFYGPDALPAAQPTV